jgi:hypothetical protein
MPYQHHTFISTQGHISPYNRNDFPGVRLDDPSTYPSIHELLERVQGEAGSRDGLGEYHFADALFGFAIRAHLDRQARNDWPSEERILQRLLEQGIYDWAHPDREDVRTVPSTPIRYTAVLGNQLLIKIEQQRDKVGWDHLSGQLRTDLGLAD